MTRRGLLTAAAVVSATVVCLSVVPMQIGALAAVVWLGAVAVAVVLASALAAALDRRDHRAVYSQVLREARKALR
jgi:hypothetical protein